ncbi:MAG: hypothetical protein OXT73_07110 [Bacteroidota bacterium]|nr:hypothetical protein [Bacteroidota bacterium]
MRLQSADSLSLKIHSFLRIAGVSVDPAESHAAQLVSYFEEEYGLSLMGFFESEWLREQLQRDEDSEDFEHARDLLDPVRRKAFDEDLASLLGANISP